MVKNNKMCLKNSLLIGETTKKKQNNKYVCINEIIQLIIMKIMMEKKKRSHR